MSPIVEAAILLSDATERMKALVGQLTVPESEYTLASATEKISGVMGDAYWSLDMKVVSYRGMEVMWDVWDGQKHFEAATLAGAVNGFLAAHEPPPAEPLEAAQAILTPAEPVPF